MEVLVWTHAMELGYPAIDAAHRKLFDEMLRLARAADDELEQGLETLSARLEQDFRDEEALMDALGYPQMHEHLAEHARILAALHHVEAGSVDDAREAVRLLLAWFEAHLETMDRALVGRRE